MNNVTESQEAIAKIPNEIWSEVPMYLYGLLEDFSLFPIFVFR